MIRSFVLLCLTFNFLSCTRLQKLYYGLQLKNLHSQFLENESAGKNVFCAKQIQSELVWLYFNNPDFSRIKAHLKTFEDALANPEKYPSEDKQSEQDGSWGICYEEWFFKLDTSYDQLAELKEKGTTPVIAPRFLDKINSPELLTNHLRSLLITDIEEGPRNHERELNETIADLMRLILRDNPKNYPYHPKLKDTLKNLLFGEFRDEKTGYWGPWYKNGAVLEKKIDLSLTFHIISYLNGEISEWPKVIDTTLSIKNSDFPAGWRIKGEPWNHLNMDVVKLYKLGWPYASVEQKEKMRRDLHEILEYCLKQTMTAEGKFKRNSSKNDESFQDTVYYGTQVLVLAGFFNKKDRFWTDEEFLNSTSIKEHLINQIKEQLAANNADNFYYQSALTALTQQ